MIIPISIAGMLVHAQKGNVKFNSGFWLAAGGVLGGLLGAQVSMQLEPLILRTIFGLLITTMGVLLTTREPASKMID